MAISNRFWPLHLSVESLVLREIVPIAEDSEYSEYSNTQGHRLFFYALYIIGWYYLLEESKA
jgi:hypothetical protein